MIFTSRFLSMGMIRCPPTPQLRPCRCYSVCWPAPRARPLTTFGHMTASGQLPSQPSGLGRGRQRPAFMAYCRQTLQTDPEMLLSTTQDLTAKEKQEMKLLRAATTVCGIALMGAALAPHAMADDWNRKTFITFSGPVEIPGVHLAGWGVLPAGTYVFKILDSQSDRHIVQIFSKDETTIYATILAIPNYRLKTTDKTVMTFRERPAAQPEALRAWFYPGKNWGEEFVYPKAKAIALAKATKTPVLFTPVELPLEVAEPVKLADANVVVEMKRAPIMAIKPTGEEVQLAQVVTPPPAETEVAMAAPPMAERALPSTASSLPLIGLLGLLAVIGAFTLRMAER